MKTIKLDSERLLGFRIQDNLSGSTLAAKLGAKVGTKIGEKPPRN